MLDWVLIVLCLLNFVLLTAVFRVAVNELSALNRKIEILREEVAQLQEKTDD